MSEAVLSAWEECCFAVPKGQARIAQRFNAGLDASRSRVLYQGRLRTNPTLHPSAVPDTGLECRAAFFPALKRRATLRMSLRDKGTWRQPFQPSKQPDSLASLQGHFAATLSRQEDVGKDYRLGRSDLRRFGRLGLPRLASLACVAAPEDARGRAHSVWFRLRQRAKCSG